MTDKKIVVVGGRSHGKTQAIIDATRAKAMELDRKNGFIVARAIFDQAEKPTILEASPPCEHFSTREKPGGDVVVVKNVRLSFPTFFLNGSPPSYPKDLGDSLRIETPWKQGVEAEEARETLKRWFEAPFYKRIAAKHKRSKRRDRRNARKTAKGL